MRVAAAQLKAVAFALKIRFFRDIEWVLSIAYQRARKSGDNAGRDGAGKR
jgi:hypothetical protein